MNHRDLYHFLVGSGLWTVVVLTWILALFWAPVDVYQGDVYRIIYLHVPSAFSAFASGLFLFLVSIQGLRTKSEKYLHWGRAFAEVGLLFTGLTLITGSIWGKPTWGTWWTWDARLTTTFILFLMYAGYLLLVTSLQPGSQRVVSASILGVLIFLDIPIIYKSVTWFRTLHQPPSLFRGDSQPTMSDEIRILLLACIIVMIIMTLWLAKVRADNIQLENDLESSVINQSFERGTRI